MSKSFKTGLSREVGGEEQRKLDRLLLGEAYPPCPQGNLIILCTGIMHVVSAQ